MLMKLFKYHKMNDISQGTKDVITGMLLGDAYLGFCNSGSKNARMQFQQNNKSFIEDLYLHMKDFVRTHPKEMKRIIKTTDKIYTVYHFYTLSNKYFTEIHSDWYRKINGKNVKVIPKNIGELLTPRAIAYWIMCDGTYYKNDNRIKICTYSFSINEVELLRNVLLTNYNIYSTTISNGYKDKNQYRILIPRKDTINLSVLVYPYLIESMHYKIGL